MAQGRCECWNLLLIHLSARVQVWVWVCSNAGSLIIVWVTYGWACVSLLHVEVCYLAVHDEVADAAGEVFVLKLRVYVRDVLVDTT